MIIPDINLLLYVHDSESPFHAKAKSWWRTCLSGTEPVGLTHVVICGFIRVGTNARAFRHPLAVSEAAAHVRSWLQQPLVQLLECGSGHTELVLHLLEGLGTAGNLTTDAQIAALVIEHDAVLHTSDADFMRFPGLRWLNPVTGTGSRALRKTSPPRF